MLVSCLGPPLPAQEISIRVLNARNGKPVTDECVNVWLGPPRGASLVVQTNKEGVAALHIEDNQVTAGAAPICNGADVAGPTVLPKGTDTIAVTGDYYIVCQEYGQLNAGGPATPDLFEKIMPSYSIKKILESGVSAANKCSKYTVEARPGELVIFVRPRTWREKMRL
jgi:hypothetical protein